MILLIDNYDSFTWNLVHRFGEIDPTIDLKRDMLVVRNDQISVDEVAQLDGGRGPSHIVISPGPCTPNEAGVSGAVINRYSGKLPILGVCLGHQCMAAFNGMTVTRHVIQVHGKTSQIHHDGRGLFAGLPNPFVATRYHSLVVLPDTIPAAVQPDGSHWQVSAWTDEATESGPTRRVVMGLRRHFTDGRDSVEGVQFHPESFLTIDGPRLLANFLRMGARQRSPRL